MKPKHFYLVALLSLFLTLTVKSQIVIKSSCYSIQTQITDEKIEDEPLEVILEKELTPGIWYKVNTKKGVVSNTFRFSDLHKGNYRSLFIVKREGIEISQTHSNVVTINGLNCKTKTTQEPAFSAFPNPADNSLYFGSEVIEVELYPIHTSIPVLRAENTSSLNISHLTQGVYRVRAVDATNYTHLQDY